MSISICLRGFIKLVNNTSIKATLGTQLHHCPLCHCYDTVDIQDYYRHISTIHDKDLAKLIDSMYGQ